MKEHEEEPLGRMIYFMAQDIRNLAERVLAPYELTLEQFQTMKSLDVTRGMSQKQLGAAIKKNPANMTRILDRLEAKSFTIRQADPEDRRAYLVFLTETGRAVLNEVSEVFAEFSEEVHRGLTESMTRTARMVLRIMAANVAKISAAMRQDQ